MNGYIEVKIIDGLVCYVKDCVVVECVICIESFEDEDLVFVFKCAYAFYDECCTYWFKIYVLCFICCEEVMCMFFVDCYDVFMCWCWWYVCDDVEVVSRGAVS